ncbi:MAG: hypothetical protein H0T45_08710 [Pyrinomonadaceae bacterium]|nr:hypothetical protein [Pyrinomonadaceae bacterium]
MGEFVALAVRGSVLRGEQSRDERVGVGFLSRGHRDTPFFINGYVAASKEDFADTLELQNFQCLS